MNAQPLFGSTQPLKPRKVGEGGPARVPDCLCPTSHVSLLPSSREGAEPQGVGGGPSAGLWVTAL